MQKFPALFILLIAFVISSCSKINQITAKPGDFVGKWNLNQVYANDYWGGKLYWKPANPDTKIEFTLDKKYYRKYPADASYTLIGTYIKLSDSTLQITRPADSVYTSSITYVLHYSFEAGGFMNLGDYGFEGVVREKFKMQK